MIEVIITKNKDTKKLRKAFRDGTQARHDKKLFYVTNCEVSFFNGINSFRYTLKKGR